MNILICCEAMMFFIRLVLWCFVVALWLPHSASAFFTENYKKNMLYGAFKKQHTADVYFNVQAGLILKTWGPNLNTALLPNGTTWNNYFNALSEEALNANMSTKYTYSINVNIGIAVHESRFRHELGFSWYAIATDTQQLTGLSQTINGTNYQFASLNGQYISKIGVYGDVYKITYNLFFDLRNVFSLLKTKWDMFFGIGAGLAIINGGAYAGEKINVSQGEGGDNTYSVVKYNPSSTTAHKYSLNKELALGVAYRLSVGVVANISQSFAASVGLAFEGTSRPLFTHKFNFISSAQGSHVNFEYHVALKIGILMKAFDIAL